MSTAVLLTAHDPIPYGRRILVAGVTGAGKSTLCRRVSDELGIPYTELDALHHGPDWTPSPDFGASVGAVVMQPEWILEWQYTSKLGDLLESRAELVVWLDPPRRVARWRLLRRTLSRRFRRTVLWNGNVEPPLHVFFTRPDDSILRWEMKTHDTWRRRMPQIIERRPDLPIVRLVSQREVNAWIARLSGERPTRAAGR